MSSSRFFPPARPRAVEGGLRAKSARGRIASTWWSSRFITLLEETGMGARLTRGRNYARRGQVISLELSAGQVLASVQGSRARPYKVRIGVNAYGKAEWARVEERLAGDAWFVSQLLAGQMPPDMEQVFDELGLAIFPTKVGDLTLDCSCPDWEVPCKHLAATFYLLAERFDEDPFEILAWRGRDRADLLARLDAADVDDEAAVVPLTELLDGFYRRPENALERQPVSSTAEVLEQLPPVTVTARRKSLIDILRPGYAVLTRRDDVEATIGGR